VNREYDEDAKLLERLPPRSTFVYWFTTGLDQFNDAFPSG
jgi:hypothetical protein